MKQITDNPEENTQSSDLTDLRMPGRRAESPWFWVQLVGGSLVFHGALLAIALPFTARPSAASQSGTPTPVEFVELSEPSPEPAVSQPPSESAAPAVSPSAPGEPVPPQPASNETIPPNDISFALEPSSKISPLPIPSPEVSPSPEASPQPSPIISPSPEIRAEEPFETAAISPQPDSLPLPVLPSASPEPPQPEQRTSAITPEPSVPEVSPDRGDRPQSASPPTDTIATALPPQNLPAPQPAAQPTDPGLQTTTIDVPVPDVSESIAAAPSTVDSDNLNSANSEAAPVGVTLNLASSSRVAPAGDEPVETLEVARPTRNSTNFLPDPSASACQVTPDVLNRVGTPIALKITTENRQGKPSNVSVYQSSGSSDYDQLAACLVKEQWDFEPATALNATGTQREAIASDELLITITINRS